MNLSCSVQELWLRFTNAVRTGSHSVMKSAHSKRRPSIGLLHWVPCNSHVWTKSEHDFKRKGLFYFLFLQFCPRPCLKHWKILQSFGIYFVQTNAYKHFSKIFGTISVLYLISLTDQEKFRARPGLVHWNFLRLDSVYINMTVGFLTLAKINRE